jgi:hypothetical protein
MTLKFKEWSVLNESGMEDKIKDWFSSNFGGANSKLNNLLGEYKSAELEYLDEWEKIHDAIDKLSLERSQIKSDPAELKKTDKFIQRNNESLAAGEKAHSRKIDYIMNKVKKVIDEDERLKKYWELNKSKLDSEIAEDMYNRSKDLASSTLSGELYNKYKAAVLKAKDRDTEFKKEYGDLLSGSDFRSESSGTNRSKVIGSAGEVSGYAKMNLGDFSRSVKNMDPKQIKDLVAKLVQNRNELYTQMEVEREALNDLISKKEGDGATKESAANKVTEIRAKYMDKIKELRSKITIARRND